MVTISRIAVPLRVGTAMAAEVAGVCLLTGILDLGFQQMLVCSECQSVHQQNSRRTMM